MLFCIILFNLGFSVFCTGQFVKQLFITEICNLYKYLKMKKMKMVEKEWPRTHRAFFHFDVFSAQWSYAVIRKQTVSLSWFIS